MNRLYEILKAKIVCRITAMRQLEFWKVIDGGNVMKNLKKFVLLLGIMSLAIGISAANAADVKTDAKEAPGAGDKKTIETKADPKADAKDLKTSDYNVKVKELEERINELKEKLFRTKTRLMLLEETMLGGVIGGAKLVIRHHNEIGGFLKLESAAYFLDSRPLYRKADVGGDLDKQKVIEIYNNPVNSSTHMLSVYLVFKGQSSVFTYVEGFAVTLKSSKTFTAKDGKVCVIDVYAYDKGGMFMAMKDRPGIKYSINYKNMSQEEIKALQQEDDGKKGESFKELDKTTKTNELKVEGKK